MRGRRVLVACTAAAVAVAGLPVARHATDRFTHDGGEPIPVEAADGSTPPDTRNTSPGGYLGEQPPITIVPKAPEATTTVTPAAEDERRAQPVDTSEARELIDERAENVKVFELDDGTRVAEVSLSPVHFEDRGTWREIDTDFERKGDAFHATASPVPVEIATHGNAEQLVAVAIDDEHRVGFSFAGAQAASAQTAGDTARYAGIRDGVDFEIHALPHGVKDKIVLHSAAAGATFRFPLDLDGLTASLAADGGVELNDGDDVVARIPPGLAWDAAPLDAELGNATAVEYRLSGTAAGPVLEVAIDPAWLADAARVFPVTIDPGLFPTRYSLPDDTLVYENWFLNWAAFAQLQAGSGTGVSRTASYLHFCTSSNDPARCTDGAPWQGGRIIGSTLGLYQLAPQPGDAACETRGMGVYRVTVPWDGTSMSRDSGYPGAGFDPDKRWASLACGEGWRYWDVTDFVRSWTYSATFNTNPAPDWGLTVRADPPVPGWPGSEYDRAAFRRFASYDFGNTAARPALQVQYAPEGVLFFPDPNPATYVQPTRNTTGSFRVTVQNIGRSTWPASHVVGVAVYRDGVYQANALTSLGAPVPPGGVRSIDATVPALLPGSYQVRWDLNGLAAESPPPPTTTIAVVSPQPGGRPEPGPGSVVGTSMPVLAANAYDPDNYPGPLKSRFTVYDAALGGNVVAQSAWLPAPWTWRPPMGTLRWNTTYWWIVEVDDGSPNGTGRAVWPRMAIHTQVPASKPTRLQPQDQGVVLATRSVATSAVDMSLPTVGPPLSIARTYVTPQGLLAATVPSSFGSGWTSMLDSRLTTNVAIGACVLFCLPPVDLGATFVGPDGSFLQWGTNPDGTFAPQSGSAATLTRETDGSYLVRDAAGTQYRFTGTDAAKPLASVTDRTGHRVTIEPRSGAIQVLRDESSGRELTITWDSARGVVTNVGTDPVIENGNQPYEWRYYYNAPDETPVPLLVAACDPRDNSAQGICTRYHYELVEEPANQSLRRGLLDRVTLPAGNDALRVQYEDDGGFYRVASRQNGAGEVTTYTSEAIGDELRVAATDSSGATRTSVFDSRDRLIREVGADGNARSVEFDERGFVSAVVDENGSRQEFDRDARGRPTTVREQFDATTWWTTYGSYIDAPGTPRDGLVSAARDARSTSASDDRFATYSGYESSTGIKVYDRRPSEPGEPPAITRSYLSNRNASISAPDTPALSSNQVDIRASVVPTDWTPPTEMTLVAQWDHGQLGYAFTLGPDGRLALHVSGDGETERVLRSAPLQLADGSAKWVRAYTFDYYARFFVSDDGVTWAPVGMEGLGMPLALADSPAVLTIGAAYGGTDWHFSGVVSRVQVRTSADGPVVADVDFTQAAGGASTIGDGYGNTYTIERSSWSDDVVGVKLNAAPEPAIGGGAVPDALIAYTTDARGNTTRFQYDQAGQLRRTTLPTGLATELTYDRIGRVRSSTVKSSARPDVTTNYEYDALGNVVAEIGPKTRDAVTNAEHQLRIERTYDGNQRLTSETRRDVKGGDAARVVTHTYDGADRRRTTTTADGTSTVEYDAEHRIITRTDAGDRAVREVYDGNGRLLEIRQPDFVDDPLAPGEPYERLVVKYGYDNAGRLISEARDGSPALTVATSWSRNGLLVRRTALGVHGAEGAPRDIVLEEHGYGPGGFDHTVIRPPRTPGSATVVGSLHRDAAGNAVREVADELGAALTTERTFDIGGAPLTERTTEAGQVVHDQAWQYDTFGRPIRHTVLVGGGAPDRTSATTYDDRGLVVSRTDPRGVTAAAVDPSFTSQFEYDELARLVVARGPSVLIVEDGAAGAVGRPTATTGFNAFGEATHRRDPRGNVTTVSFDASGRVEEEHAPLLAGQGSGVADIDAYVRYAYDGSGNLVARTHYPTGITTGFVYDSGNRLFARVDPKLANRPAAGVTTFRCDNRDLLRETVDPTGAVVQHRYDELGRRVSSTDVVRTDANAEYTTTFAYGDQGDLVATTDPTGVTVRFGYDGLGRRTSTEDAFGTTTTAYRQDGWDVVTTDAAGHATRTRTNLGGEVVEHEQVAADGSVAARVATAYDRAGNVEAVSVPAVAGGPDRMRQRYFYDTASRPTATIDFFSASAAAGMLFSYDAAGNRTRVTDGNGNVTTYRYNAWNLVASEREPTTEQYPNDADRLTSMVYDARGLTQTVIRPGGVTDSMTYDVLPNLLTQASSGGGAAAVSRSFLYDEASRMVQANQPNGTQSFAYDDRHLVRTTAGPNPVKFTYDAAGRPLTRIDAAGTSQWTYAVGSDGAGQLATATDPLTNVVRQYDYDDTTGELQRVQVGAIGTAREYTWDAAGRLAADTLTRAGAPVRRAEQTYDPAGNLVQRVVTGAVADAGTHDYTYDLGSRLTSWQWTKPTGAPASVAYGWDRAGNRTSVAGGAVQVLFVVGSPLKLTPAERLLRARLETTLGFAVVLRDDTDTEDTAGAGFVVISPSVADAQLGQKYGEDLPVPVVNLRRQSWVNGGLASGVATANKPNVEIADPAHPIAAGLSGSVAITSSARAFGRATVSAGAKTVVRVPGVAAAAGNVVFAYDPGAVLVGGASAVAKRVGVGFDEAVVVALNADGWRLFDQAVGWVAPPLVATTFTFNARNQVVSNSRGDGWSYSARGTRTSERVAGVTKTLVFDAADRLVGDGATSYQYDGFDRLFKRGTTTFGYAGAGPEVVAVGATKIALDLDGSAAAYQVGSRRRLTLSDVGRGDVIGALDGSGNVVATRGYEPWGSVAASTGVWDAPVGFQGDYSDPTTGKSHMGARWYDPGSGNFASADSWRLDPVTSFSANRYGYANTNPLRYSDPTGHFVEPTTEEARAALGLCAQQPACAAVVAGCGSASVCLAGVAAAVATVGAAGVGYYYGTRALQGQHVPIDHPAYTRGVGSPEEDLFSSLVYGAQGWVEGAFNAMFSPSNAPAYAGPGPQSTSSMMHQAPTTTTNSRGYDGYQAGTDWIAIGCLANPGACRHWPDPSPPETGNPPPERRGPSGPPVRTPPPVDYGSIWRTLVGQTTAAFVEPLSDTLQIVATDPAAELASSAANVVITAADVIVQHGQRSYGTTISLPTDASETLDETLAWFGGSGGGRGDGRGTRTCVPDDPFEPNECDNETSGATNTVDDLADDVVLARGGANTPDRFAGGSGVTTDAAGNLRDVSVNSGRTVEEAAQGIPHNQIGVSTVGDVRSAGGSVVRAPIPGNAGHCLVSGLTAETLSWLFTPTIKNPCR